MDDLKDVIKDENNNPLLLEGKTMTLNDFKKNLGRI